MNKNELSNSLKNSPALSRAADKANPVSEIQQVKKIQNEIGAIKNSLADLTDSLPQSAYMPLQINNFETLTINNRYNPISIQRVLLAWLYVEHGIIQSFIDQPVQDALRGGLEITSDEMDDGDIDDLQNYLDEKNILGTIVEAEIWKRVFGGSGIIVNQSVDPAQPFKQEKTDELEFYVADRWELAASQKGAEFYNFYNVEISKDRVIHLTGKKPPSFIRPQFQGWGMSELEHVVRELNAYFKNKGLVFELLDEAKIDIYKINHFNSSLMTAAGTDRIQKRIQISNQLKNFQNALMIDKEDDYEQKTLTFGGLSDMAKENRMELACALRMPITKLFGVSASGFNSGEDDIENYNGMIESEIRAKLRQPLRNILDLCCAQVFGYIPAYRFKFKPLRMMDDKDEEQVITSRANRIMALYDKGLMSAEEVGKSLRAYKSLPITTDLEKGLVVNPTPPQGVQEEKLPGGVPEGTKSI